MKQPTDERPKDFPKDFLEHIAGEVLQAHPSMRTDAVLYREFERSLRSRVVLPKRRGRPLDPTISMAEKLSKQNLSIDEICRRTIPAYANWSHYRRKDRREALRKALAKRRKAAEKSLRRKASTRRGDDVREACSTQTAHRPD